MSLKFYLGSTAFIGCSALLLVGYIAPASAAGDLTSAKVAVMPATALNQIVKVRDQYDRDDEDDDDSRAARRDRQRRENARRYRDHDRDYDRGDYRERSPAGDAGAAAGALVGGAIGR